MALTWIQAAALSALGVAAFHVAYCVGNLCLIIVVFLYCLCALTRLATDRRAFDFVGRLRLKEAGTRPVDRWLAPLAVLITVVAIIWPGLSAGRRRMAIS